ncbi:MAG: NAD-dependent epimerase [Magnetococcales bacterium]|nr:NAD-dependent epimerase [Magnetococcales bacterium]
MALTLVTGAAGFIGFHLTKKLLDRGDSVVGVDNLNDYYDPKLKQSRLSLLLPLPNFQFFALDIAHRESMQQMFRDFHFNAVVNLAAQAGVRYSIDNPYSYIESNIVGFANLLEGCRHSRVDHLVFASSSSIYGANTRMPFSVHHNVDHPLSLYAASKKTNELMAHTYAHLFRLPTTGLRFFTVYGPWGRPDMALFKFTRAILSGLPMEVYNHGRMQRDFTYIDDIIEGIIRIVDRPAAPDPLWDSHQPDPATSNAPYRIYNIGNNRPVELMHYIEALELFLGRQGIKTMLPMQPGDVSATWADIDDLVTDFGFKPQTSIETGIERFVSWYRDYYKV